MIRRKSKFLTFCFSMLPGAGHMYLGLMKQGTSLLTAFCALLFFASWLGIGPLLFLLPILWCYSFFDAINKNSMNDEDFYALEDDYLFHFNEISELVSRAGKGKTKLGIALICLILGIYLLYNNILLFLRFTFGWHFLSSLDLYLGRIPQIAFAVIIIAFGVSLIQEKKEELEHEGTEQTHSEEHACPEFSKEDLGELFHQKEDSHENS